MGAKTRFPHLVPDTPKEQAENHLLAKKAQASPPKIATRASKPKSSSGFLGFPKSQYVLAVVIGVPAMWFAWYMGSKPTEVKTVDRASTAEVMECKDRIERRFAGTHNVDISVLTGTSSDRKGPGATSRVKMYFELEAPGGVISKHHGMCQFADGVQDLIVLPG